MSAWGAVAGGSDLEGGFQRQRTQFELAVALTQETNDKQYEQLKHMQSKVTSNRSHTQARDHIRLCRFLCLSLVSARSPGRAGWLSAVGMVLTPESPAYNLRVV